MFHHQVSTVATKHIAAISIDETDAVVFGLVVLVFLIEYFIEIAFKAVRDG